MKKQKWYVLKKKLFLFLFFFGLSIFILNTSFALTTPKQTKAKTSIPKPTQQSIPITQNKQQMEKIVLGAGCFWCVESIFQRLKGVHHVQSGYSGGKQPNPTYEQVCGPHNDYIEVCEILYDPKVISLSDLLRVFFYTHDPTTLNKQGNDVGYQYRSTIFYTTEEQKKIAINKIMELDKQHFFTKPIVTDIRPLKNFYIAEKYHNNYYKNNPEQPYCKMIIEPKLQKFEKIFHSQLK